jgi:hypothetical protein
MWKSLRAAVEDGVKEFSREALSEAATTLNDVRCEQMALVVVIESLFRRNRLSLMWLSLRLQPHYAKLPDSKAGVFHCYVC